MQIAFRDFVQMKAQHLRDCQAKHTDKVSLGHASAYLAKGNVFAKEKESCLKYFLPSTLPAYHAFLAQEVDLYGSKGREYVEIEQQEEGYLHVRMYNVIHDAKGDQLLLDRKFAPHETHEVRIWGLGNDDIFHFLGEDHKDHKIKVKIFGGQGDDHFKGNCFLHAYLHDKDKATRYQVEGKGKVVKKWNEALYDYHRQQYVNRQFVPLFSLGYNNNSGLESILAGNWVSKKFEQDTYGSWHQIKVGFTTQRTFSLAYKARFHHVVGKWDFLWDGFVSRSNSQNRFYGLGNNTENLQDQFGKSFYASAVNTDYIKAGISRNFWKQSTIHFAYGLERNESVSIANTFLDQQKSQIIGATPGSWKSLPLSARLDLDGRDSQTLPYRGGRAVLTVENHRLVGKRAGNFQKASAILSYFVSTPKEHPITLGLRAGGSTSSGNLPWFHLPSLGANTGLRGFARNRFVGTSAAYFNADLRYQVTNVNASCTPFKFGVKAFYDRGRVFYQAETERDSWRTAYGFGVFFSPESDRMTISISCGFSSEEFMYPVFNLSTPLR